MSVSDAAIVARWKPRLKIREALLAAARRREAYWSKKFHAAKSGTKARSHAYQMVKARKALVRKREQQVSDARRVIARHAGPTRTVGIDVSNFQPNVDWAKVRNAGYRFAFCKASEGASFKDSTLHSHVTGAKKAGLIVGAYHFLHPGNVNAQVENFLAQIKAAGLGKGDLLPVIDVEWNVPGPDPTEVDVVAFVHGVQRALGVRPVIYTAPGFIPSWSSTHGCKLWVADFGVLAPTLPHPWTADAAWQYSSSANVPGVGKCDVNKTDNLQELIW